MSYSFITITIITITCTLLLASNDEVVGRLKSKVEVASSVYKYIVRVVRCIFIKNLQIITITTSNDEIVGLGRLSSYSLNYTTITNYYDFDSSLCFFRRLITSYD